MYWRREYLREAAAMPVAKTYIEKLPSNGLLSSVYFRISVRGVSGAFAASLKWRVCDYISKLEIIGDGSIVIKSLSGQELQALQWYDTNISTLDYWHSYASGTQRFHFVLNFGRFFLDRQFGLDLSRFKNVEIRITNNAAAAQYDEDFAISMLCYYMEGAGAGGFGGYMRTEEWRTWATVQNAWEYLELPTESKIRRIMLQLIPPVDAYNIEKTSMSNLADDIELSIRTGVLRLYRGGIDDIMRENALWYKKLAETYPSFYMTAAYGRNVGIGYVLGGAWGAGNVAAAAASVIPTMESKRTSATQKPRTYVGDEPFDGKFTGLCPEYTVMLPFDQDLDPVDWLDPNVDKTVKLDIHTANSANAAAGTINVVLDRLVI